KREGRTVSAEQREINRRLLDTMARAEHARFVVERYLAGWKWGEEKDEKAKTNPTLISWRDLSESVRELDRTAVRNIPKFLRELNLEVVPEGDGKS
ncbi:MAG TPA: RyR domain-containing protein, partial [Phycisphaerae bacterium]|nr:RyR domain-containing protein [Phycisphaerae bacterium]